MAPGAIPDADLDAVVMSERVRILVVDDDPFFRSLISSLLQGDYAVATASDGSEGFYKALEEPPDVAIIDIRMPNWDGLRTLRAFQAHPALCRVKVMILSSDASRETILAATQGGASEYVVKTAFHRGDFLEKLARLLPEGAPVPGREEPCDPAAADTARVRSTARAGNSGRLPGPPVLKQTRPGTSTESRLQAILDDWE